jgi:cellulose synthase/poly-beta-1,6-N-acetylglucosamine synthase-like glycosyltransferase
MSWVIIGFLVLGGYGLVQAILMLLWTFESARFMRSRLGKPAPGEYLPKVQLYIPCKGVEPTFDQMVESVRRQNYPAYQVTFIVESTDDPAHGRLLELLRGAPAGFKVVVAGKAVDCSQKVHNLLSATAHIDPDIEAVAFADSDIVMEPDWLRWLVARLNRPGIGATTGYRWMLPRSRDWLAQMVAALNAGVASGLGNHHAWNPIWGGSWAMRRETFERLEIRRWWRGTLADDLPVWLAVRQANLQVYFEPGCLTASPIHVTLGGLLSFARRQYLAIRVYTPDLWWGGFLVGLGSQGIFWLGVIVALCSAAAGHPWTVWVVLLVGLLYLLHTVRAWMRHTGVFSRLARWSRPLRRVARLDILAHPLLGLVGLSFYAISAFGRVVTWRRFRYRLVSLNQTEILVRGDA